MNFKMYFEEYYNALKGLYVDEVTEYDNFKVVKSDIIDDNIWNFIYDIKAEKYEDFIKSFNLAKTKFSSRVPRFYILNGDNAARFIAQLKKDYNMCGEDSWFLTPIKDLSLNYRAKIDVNIGIPYNKEEIIDTMINGFSTHDPQDPYGDLSPTYKECLERRLTDAREDLSAYYIAKHDGRPISLLRITLHGKNAYLNDLTTLKEFRGQSVAKELLTYVINVLKKKQIENIMFATETGAYTEEFYKKLGFKLVEYGYCYEEKS